MITMTIDKPHMNMINQTVKALPVKVQRNGMRKVMRRFTAAIRNKARTNAPVRTKRLRKSITNKVSIRYSSGVITGRVLVDSSKHGVHYGHLLEWGTPPHGKHPGNAGTRYMTRAFEELGTQEDFRGFFVPTMAEEFRKLGIKVPFGFDKL